MHIVHLVSNYKWTERSEPTVDLILGQRALGASATLVCGRSRAAPKDSIAYQSTRKGVEPVLLELPKHFRWRRVIPDLVQLRRLYRAKSADVVHCHMPNAHLMGVLSVRRFSPRPVIIKSLYDPDELQDGFRFKRICLPGTDGFIVIGEDARQHLIETHNVPFERVAVIEPAIDLERFGNPAIQPNRSAFELQDDHFVVGMVVAFGPRRRIDIALGAIKRLAERIPELRLLMIGRGKVWDVIEKPAMELGIRDRVILGGYCRDDRLVEAYRSMDVLAYPMPGTDKSCRTVREAMACGLPVVATHVGFLPRLVEDGVTGRLVELSSESMAEAVESLYRDRTRMRRMGEAARETAQRRFSRLKQAEHTLAFYRHVAELSPG